MEEKQQIFRKKSLERMKEPEMLDACISTASTGARLLLPAIAVLVIGALIWCFAGRIGSSFTALAYVENGRAVLWIEEENAANISAGAVVGIGGEETELDSISALPVCVREGSDEYALHAASLQPGDWVYEAEAATSAPDGLYMARITEGSVRPAYYIFNR